MYTVTQSWERSEATSSSHHSGKFAFLPPRCSSINYHSGDPNTGSRSGKYDHIDKSGMRTKRRAFFLLRPSAACYQSNLAFPGYRTYLHCSFQHVLELAEEVISSKRAPMSRLFPAKSRFGVREFITKLRSLFGAVGGTSNDGHSQPPVKTTDNPPDSTRSLPMRSRPNEAANNHTQMGNRIIDAKNTTNTRGVVQCFLL